MAEQPSYQVWRDPALATKFLEGIRGGVPFAADQIDLMLRVVRAAGVPVDRLLDIGCGDGILGRALLDRFPQAHGTFLDFSEAMVAAARNQLQPYAHRCQVVPGDFGRADGSRLSSRTGRSMWSCPDTRFITSRTNANGRSTEKSTTCSRRTDCS